MTSTKAEFTGAVPEIPVADLDRAQEYYANRLGFTLDWSDRQDGFAGISKGHCRLFLTDAAFRGERRKNHFTAAVQGVGPP